MNAFEHTMLGIDRILNGSPRVAGTGPRPRVGIAPEGSEGTPPAADRGPATVGLLYPVTCAARYYDVASKILEDEPNLFTHENADELGHVIQKWLEETRANWEPR